MFLVDIFINSLRVTFCFFVGDHSISFCLDKAIFFSQQQKNLARKKIEKDLQTRFYAELFFHIHHRYLRQDLSSASFIEKPEKPKNIMEWAQFFVKRAL